MKTLELVRETPYPAIAEFPIPSEASPEEFTTPEVSAAEIAQTLSEARKTVYRLTADPGFHKACLERGVDPYDTEKSEYWDVVADHGHAAVERGLENGADSLRLRAFDLLATTPATLLTQIRIDGSHIEPNRQDIARVSQFNGRLRTFAASFPSANTTDVTRAMLGMASNAIEARELRQTMPDMVRRVMRGAQHELAFGQILARTGRDFRPATHEDDLQGTDYIVKGNGGQDLRIDVKASLFKFTPGDAPMAYQERTNGVIMMFSMTKDEEFRDKFFLPHAVAASKAPIVDQMLIDIEMNRKTA